MIRPLTIDDLDDFIRIRLFSLKLNPEAFGATYEEGVDRETARKNLAKKSEEDLILGYFHENKLIAIVGFIRHQRVNKRHQAWLWGMFVDPQYRKQGIGSRLLLECIRKAQKMEGLEQLCLSITDRAREAKALYEGVGFQAWGREPKSFKTNGMYISETHMSKPLF